MFLVACCMRSIYHKTARPEAVWGGWRMPSIATQRRARFGRVQSGHAPLGAPPAACNVAINCHQHTAPRPSASHTTTQPTTCALRDAAAARSAAQDRFHPTHRSSRHDRHSLALTAKLSLCGRMGQPLYSSFDGVPAVDGCARSASRPPPPGPPPAVCMRASAAAGRPPKARTSDC